MFVDVIVVAGNDEILSKSSSSIWTFCVYVDVIAVAGNDEILSKSLSSIWERRLILRS